MKHEFINLKGKLGKLYILKVLIQYDYPSVFICINDNKKYFLFYEISEDSTFDKWVVKTINRKTYENLISKYCYFIPSYNSITYEDILKKEKGKNYLIERKYDDNCNSFDACKSISQEELLDFIC